MAEKINFDNSIEDADWTKQSWDLPPYGSKEFFEVMPIAKLDWFRTTGTYKAAVAQGLIHDDEWMADWCSDPASPTRI